MLIIRHYLESDALQVGQLIAATYSAFNLNYMPPEERGPFLGPFRHAWSHDLEHQQAIAEILPAAIMLVAEQNGEIVGVLRGKPDKLQSLFVRGDRHRQGIGRSLVQRFEQECLKQGSRQIKLMATLFAVSFYQAMGYRKSTGVRKMRSFEGEGLPYQPMKKALPQ